MENLLMDYILNRREARRLVETCGVGGELVLGASSTVSFDVPVQNIAALYEAVRLLLLMMNRVGRTCFCIGDQR
jgi:hypothetical protein